MNAYCPECETDLDQATGICPACRWDPRAVVAPAPIVPQMSLTERYRGTGYDLDPQGLVLPQQSHISRGRAFVLMALVAVAAFYGVVLALLGMV
jgi:hypothetical protein